MSYLLSPDNPVFRSYLFYCGALTCKMWAMSLLTAYQRSRKKVFSNSEDLAMAKGAGKIKFDDPDVERVRRAHMNDIENIPIFVVASFGYLMTNPVPWVAINLMRAFTVARFAHTFVYTIVIVGPPARSMCFFVGYAITAYMAGRTLLTFM